MAKCQSCEVEYVSWTSRVPNTCTLCAEKQTSAPPATAGAQPAPEVLRPTEARTGGASVLVSSPGSAAATRYQDGYLVARTTNGIGAVVKTLSIVLGVSIGLVALLVGANTNALFVLVGLVLAAMVGVPLYVLGVLLAAQGQVLKAGLDAAVHTSSFLSEEEKARAMSLV